MSGRIISGAVASSTIGLILILSGCASNSVLAGATANNPTTVKEGTVAGTVAGAPTATLPDHAFATYDEVITLAGQSSPIQMKVWMKGGQARFEASSKDGVEVTLVNSGAQVEYSYVLSQKTAAKVDLIIQANVPLVTTLTTTSAWEWAQMIINNPDSIAPYHCQYIDDLHCFVVETPYQGDILKSWMASDYALPLRLEYLGNVVELKNFVFASQPDSLFQLPSGMVIKK